jgi:hypothetical protein
VRAASYTLREDPDGLPRWLVMYRPPADLSPGSGPLPKAEHVGYIVEERGGGWRCWKSNESPGERMFRGLHEKRHDAVAVLLPDDDFPELCVLCGKNEPCGDASAFTEPGARGASYSSNLDDHCEDCLPAGAENEADAWI